MNQLKKSLQISAAFGGLWIAVGLVIVGWEATAAEKKVAFAELPAAAQKVIQEHQGTGKLGDIKQTIDGGETVFEAEVVKADETYSLSVSPDGKWYSVEIELTEAPKPVQNKARQLAGSGTIDNVSKVLEEGDVSYEVEMTLTNRHHSYSIGPRGKVWSHSVEVKLSEAPAAVQKTIKEQLGKGKLGDIYRVDEEGEVYFQVETTKAGKEYNFSVAPDGKFLGVDE